MDHRRTAPVEWPPHRLQGRARRVVNQVTALCYICRVVEVRNEQVGPEGATVRVPVVEGNAYRAEFSIPSGAVVPIHYAVTFDFD